MKSSASSRLTSRGILILTVGIGGLLASLALRDSILLTLSVSIFIAIAGAWFFSKWNLTKLTVEADIPARVHAGHCFDSELQIHNRRRLLDAFQLKLVTSFPSSTHVHADALWVPATTTSMVQRRLSLPHRSHALNIPYVIRSEFPFGIVSSQRSGHVKQYHSLIVYPKSIVPRELIAHGSLNDMNPKAAFTHGDSAGEPRGIRQWQSGDSAKKIHWPASARSLACGNDLRVRENDPPGFHADRCHIIFHSFGTDGALLREDRFERALALLAGTLKYLLQRGIDTTLRADFMAWLALPCTNRPQYLDCLAHLAQTSRASGTEAHELSQLLETIPKGEASIIISDIEPTSWLPHIQLPPSCVIIDIRQAHFQRRKTRH